MTDVDEDTAVIDEDADGDACASDPESQTEVRSTKRPLSQSSTSTCSKKRKKTNPEDELLHKAITCMETAMGETPTAKADEYDLFGRYIAAEIRAIEDAQARCWAKLQIQTVFFNMQTGMRSMQHYTAVPPSSHLASTPTPTGSFSPYDETSFGSPYGQENDI